MYYVTRILRNSAFLVVCGNGNMSRFEHVRCNPDVAPRLTSGGYEEKHDFITPINILFIGGGEF